jgi:adenylate cyclase
MKRFSIRAITGIILLVLFLTLLIRLIPALDSLELKTIDWRFNWRGPLPVEDSPIVLVTIDDQSFESLPSRWPWPRYYYAEVIENLTQAGAKVIGVDVILDVPDVEHEGSDQKMADAIQQSGRVVLAGKIEYGGRGRSYANLVTPIPVLLAADGTWGLTSMEADRDGMYRQYVIAQPYQEEILPSFGLQVLRKYFDIPVSDSLRIEEGIIHLAGLRIPLSSEGMLRINFAGPAGTFPQHSFESVIDDEQFSLKEDYDLDYFSTSLLPDEVFKDKIVLIGSTVSELHDNFPTPFFEFTDRQGNERKAEMPGVEIHANAIWSILNSLYYKEINHWLSLAMVLLLIIVVYLMVLRLKTALAIGLSAGLLIFYNLLQFYLFARYRYIMPMVMPTLGMVLGFIASTLHHFIITQKEKKVILTLFEWSVGGKVVKELQDHPEKARLGGDERFLTVIFMDLENFTSITERMKRHDLVSLINLFFTEMSEIVLKFDGHIDKYLGDAIMAEFGAPIFFEDHAIKACHAALEMQERLRKLDLSKYKDTLTSLSGRIGITSGNMTIGMMGSEKRKNYTVIGDPVNLASRLEGANKTFGTHIMISEDTFKLAKDEIISRPIDMIRVKGRQRPARVFELVATREQSLPKNYGTILPVFTNGIKYYHTRDWKKAEDCFQFCLNLMPDDGPSKEYLRRAIEFKLNPPPEDWDGVYTMHTK